MGTVSQTPGGPDRPITSPVAGSLGQSSSGLETCVVDGLGSHRDKWEKTRQVQVAGETVEFVACDHHTDQEIDDAVAVALDHIERGQMPPTMGSAFSPTPASFVPGGTPSASVPSVVPPPVESVPGPGTPMRPLRSSNLKDLVKRVGGDPSKAERVIPSKAQVESPASNASETKATETNKPPANANNQQNTNVRPSTAGAPRDLGSAVNRVNSPNPVIPPTGAVPPNTPPASRATTGEGAASSTTTQADTAKAVESDKPVGTPSGPGSAGPSGIGQK